MSEILTIEEMILQGATENKKTVDEWLDSVDYTYLNSSAYVPSKFALTYMNLIKLINGAEGESNLTPPMHLKMLDSLIDPNPFIANLVFRGSGKTTIFMEYFTLIMALINYLPNFGDIESFIYVTDSMDNGAKSAKDNIQTRYNNSEFLQHWIPEAKFNEGFLQFRNRNGKRLGVKLYGAQTGLRGTKIYGKRPQLAILDDLIGDLDANSPTVMRNIKNTIYRGVTYALDPTKFKIIFNGTPFNKSDAIVEAVESGGWKVNVWPVAEKFPCEPHEFIGAWPDRFTYESVLSQYTLAVANGETASFMQELMLRIGSDEEALVNKNAIKWYSRDALMAQAQHFNFYITTDFATTDKQGSDFNVISVWALNNAGDWFWVDGIRERQTMDKTIEDLFRLVTKYLPQSVGIEISGQQGAFIQWIRNEMMAKNVYFTLAGKNGKAGIYPVANKLSRFNIILPVINAGKFHFPIEMRTSDIIKDNLEELYLATRSGFKGKDDFSDTVSMLAYMDAITPTSSHTDLDGKQAKTGSSLGYWGDDDFGDDDYSPLDSYIV